MGNVLMPLAPTGVRLLSAVRGRLGRRPVVLDGNVLDPQMQLVLDLLESRGGTGTGPISTPRGRRGFTKQSQLAGGEQPIGAVTSRVIDTPGGRLALRFYTPTDAVRPTPGLLYLHGGGFIVGDLDSHEATCRAIAERAGVRVVAVDYRLAPEHPFPAALDDALAAWGWLVEHAESLNMDAGLLAVGGDSAGANLAMVVASEMVRTGGPVPASQLLIYPVTDFDGHWKSRDTFGQGFLLVTEFMKEADDSYVLGDQDRTDPRLSPLFGDLSGLPPAVVSTAGFDPLRDEGLAWVAAAEAAGVDVQSIFEPGLVHGWVGMLGISTSASAALDRLVAAFQRTLLR